MGITDVIVVTFEKLLNSYNGKEKLIFPNYRDSSIRVSEQEARFCFASIIEKETSYRYSIETPTQETYSQTGTHELSAQSDMSLWSSDGNKKLYNIEFKAHNATKESIKKDIQKLVKEGIEGVWFHVLRNADKATFPALAKKFEESLIEYTQYRNKDIIFAICVLDKKVGICGKLSSEMKSNDEIIAFFNDASNLIKEGQINQIAKWNRYVLL